MIKSFWLRVAVILVLLCGKLEAGRRDSEWTKVEQAKQERLPATEAKLLEGIYNAALAEKAYPEAIKAIALKIVAESASTPDPSTGKIEKLASISATAPAEMRPVLETILAFWYWDYFKQNRWKIAQRTATSASPSDDFRTWDLSRLLGAIDAHFSNALKEAPALQKIPIADFGNLLAPGNLPDEYRPTLYDFLAHEALQFYVAGETSAVVGEDEFIVESDGPIFGNTNEFLNWKPEKASDSLKGRAIQLLQNLLRFHQGDRDRTAFFDAELVRLVVGAEMAEGETKDARYLEALKRLSTEASDTPIAADALAKIAEHLVNHDQPAEARVYAQRGYKRFPESRGGAACFNRLQQIEAKEINVAADAAWSPTAAEIRVTYRNVDHIYFRLYRTDWERELDDVHSSRDEVNNLLRKKADAEWKASLPPTPDWKPREETLSGPKDLKPGFYILVASHDRSFAMKENALFARPIWVTNLALLVENDARRDEHRGLVVNATTGQPIEKATVELWNRDRGNDWRRTTSFATDKDGAFRFTAEDPGSLFLLAKYGNDQVAPITPWWFYDGNPASDHARHLTFFTDRSLYRPGQTVSYKGVALSADAKGKYSVAARQNVTVVFSDLNGREIARAVHTTGEFGSFAGTFTAPKQGLTGVMRLVAAEWNADATVRVEEYKRPKFQVEIAAPTHPAKLGNKVEVAGRAASYSGATVGGAKVRWRVERATRFPVWLWWIQPIARKAIAHGTAVTGDDGSFSIAFEATPEPSAKKEDQPVFEFSIHADVTDTTGETRSEDRNLALGYTALQATVTADEYLDSRKPVEFSVSTSTLDGQPQAAKGKLVVYRLAQPDQVTRARIMPWRTWTRSAPKEPAYDGSNIESWKNQESIATKSFSTDAEGAGQIALALSSGAYRVELSTKDAFGTEVTARKTFVVVNPDVSRADLKLPNFAVYSNETKDVGGKCEIVWGTGYDRGRAYVTIEKDGGILKAFWTGIDRTQQRIEVPITEELRGGFTTSLAFVHDNQAYFTRKTIDVPWSNKALQVKWGTFRSKLEPGQREVWTAEIRDPQGKPARAEMVAALYDSSLDQFAPHQWPGGFANVFRLESDAGSWNFSNQEFALNLVSSFEFPEFKSEVWNYRSLPNEITESEENVVLSPFTVSSSLAGYRGGASARAAAPAAMMAKEAARDRADTVLGQGMFNSHEGGAQQPDLSKISARKNLNETAFFFPQLLSNKDGDVKLEFTMPEALTRWKFLGFAHDRELRAGLLTDYAVTSKELMVEPNPPRFLREGDVVEFTVKVSNQSDQTQRGKVRLNFSDALTEKRLDAEMSLQTAEQAFEIPAKQGRTFSWRITVPDGLGVIRFKAVAASEKFSDGEENYLPVLSRRIAVTESLPLPMRGQGTKEFELKKLLAAGSSKTLQSQLLSVEMVSQPAWYAVMSLPYLMEYPYECSEQVFNRLYANQLAQHIAQSDPKIRRVFDLWRGTSATESPLQKNQDVKSVLIEETPWLRDAQNATQSRQNIGLLFEENRLASEKQRALQTLLDRQNANGLWSWFPGGEPSEFISLYIATGFGRLRHLGVEIDPSAARKAWAALDQKMAEKHGEILRGPKPDDYVPSSLDVLYLYGRSFFLQDLPLSEQQMPATGFFQAQARRFWTSLVSRQSEAQLAIALNRLGDEEGARAIMKSLKERAITGDEMGMFWSDKTPSWWWYNAPIETQAVMIEAFSEVTEDNDAVEACKVWLLKQKQTQQWPTTKATADASYALLLRGENLLASDALVEVSLGGQKIVPENVEAGTGYFEKKILRSEVKPEMGRITLKKSDPGVSWGSVHWQYLEDIAKVEPHEGTPLTLKKTLYVRENTSKGPVMKAVNGPVGVGDELVVRIELRCDRDMEFIHLKDQRGSGTEPVNVLSQYKYQDGLGYYESTRDTATHFFIDYVKAGTYVFEYPIRVQLKGIYQSGIAEVQCMYAPEFNSHSGSVELRVE